jgi:curved DNA-binding protein CbpA
MAELPDYYADLGVNPKAGHNEIERVYQQRAARLRASKIEDAPEELAEVEQAYAVLHDRAKRAEYDRKVHQSDAEQDKKDAELNAYLQSVSRRHRHTNRRTGFLGGLLDLLNFWK